MKLSGSHCETRGISHVDVGRDEAGDEFFEFEYNGVQITLLWGWPRMNVIRDGVVRENIRADIYSDVEEAIMAQFEELNGLGSIRDPN